MKSMYLPYPIVNSAEMDILSQSYFNFTASKLRYAIFKHSDWKIWVANQNA